MDRETRRKLEEERLARAAMRAAGVPIPPSSGSSSAGTSQPQPSSQPSTAPPPPPAASAPPAKRVHSVTISDDDEAGPAKRARPVSASSQQPSEVVVLDDSDTDDGEPAPEPARPVATQKPVSARPVPPSRPVVAAAPPAPASPANVTDAKIKYLDGQFLLTATGPHQAGRLRYEDLIEKDHLQAAILSSFVWEPEWLLPKLPLHIRLCFINNKTSPIELPETLSKRVIKVEPNLGGFGYMHVKLSVFIYKTFMRVAIGSANLISYDWSGMENVVHVQDFPKPTTPADAEAAANDRRFFTELSACLRDLEVPNNVYRFMAQYDTRRWRAHLVFSRNGSCLTTDHPSGYGITALAQAASRTGWAGVVRDHAPPLEVVAATSSLGALDHAFLRQCLEQVRGGASRSSQEADEIKVLFPTAATVLGSVYGAPGGGSLWLRRDMWERQGYPREVFYALESKTDGYLSHCKILYAVVKQTLSAPTIPDGEPIGLYYAGSHNFTKAAWGSYWRNAGKVSMNNYELGVVYAIHARSELGTRFPVPFKTPRKYGDGDEPWIQGDYPQTQSGEEK
ncbi:hypothetical protein H9P43_001979 [Blastocladiella emersonii ATCC 22665]|nr:hypothetical protein H9P43_001979 [Blastocladiella emersonii ATCC 22665]